VASGVDALADSEEHNGRLAKVCEVACLQVFRCLALRPVPPTKKRPDWRARAGEQGVHPCPAVMFCSRRVATLGVLGQRKALLQP
jgi:hypothetical protein